MKYVDQIIGYLSGDLKPGEKKRFEEQLATDPELSEEFEQVSAAWELAREGFRRKDREAFREKLRQVMETTPLPGKVHKRRHPGWFLILSVAASLAILLVILTLTGREDHLYGRFYRPKNDPVILAMGHDTRGDAGQGISLYMREDFAASQRSLEAILEEEPDEYPALLFYLLSSMELRQEEEVLPGILARDIGSSGPAERAIRWYTSLALIRSERYAEASHYLQPLAEQPGSYSKEARKLQKQLSKLFLI